MSYELDCERVNGLVRGLFLNADVVRSRCVTDDFVYMVYMTWNVIWWLVRQLNDSQPLVFPPGPYHTSESTVRFCSCSRWFWSGDQQANRTLRLALTLGWMDLICINQIQDLFIQTRIRRELRWIHQAPSALHTKGRASVCLLRLRLQSHQ